MTQKAPGIDQRPAMQNASYGNCVVHEGKLAPTTPTTCEPLHLVRIPAGTRIQELIILNDDGDSTTTPTITCRVGYTPVNSADGPAESLSYWFGTGQTILQAAARNVSIAKPITFDYDVYVTLTVQAISASFISGAEIHCIARGEPVGLA